MSIPPELLSYHRLLTRMDSALEFQNAPSTHWVAPNRTPVITNSPASIPRCVSVYASTAPLLAPTPQSTSMSIGSIVAPGTHPDLANDGALLWSCFEPPLQPRAQPMFSSHIPECAADSPFCSSPPETCPSPPSEAAFSLAPHATSTISSGSVSFMDDFPKDMMKHEITASPLQMATLLHWDGSDAGMPPSQLLPISLEEDLITVSSLSEWNPSFAPGLTDPFQCQYPSPSWSSSDCLPYEDHVQPINHFQAVGWKTWPL